MNLRPATMADADLLMAWRNDPLTCSMFLCSKPVEREQHVQWLSAYLQKPLDQHRLYIAEVDQPVGTIRLDRDAQARWEISYTIASEHRGKGYSTAMLKAVAQWHFGLLAAIKPENEASIRAVKSAGFVRSPWDRDGLQVYVLTNAGPTRRYFDTDPVEERHFACERFVTVDYVPYGDGMIPSVHPPLGVSEHTLAQIRDKLLVSDSPTSH